MKLKYYMRGLGTGILFTLFVFVVIIIPNLKLENKINEATSASGQTDKDGSDVSALVGRNDQDSTGTPDASTPTPDENKDPVYPTTNGDEPSEAPSASPSETVTEAPEDTATPTAESAETPAPTQEPTETPTPTNTPTPTPVPSPTPTPTQEPTKAPTPTPVPTKTPTKAPQPTPTGAVDDSTGTVTISITKGMISETICKALEKYGVVDNWESLNSYISRHGYSQKIQVGTYSFTRGMSYDAVCKKIMGKNYK